MLEAQVAWQPEGQPLQSIPLNREISIGRVAGNDIILTDTALSRQHARLQVTENGIALQDLGSLNGTFLNGEKVEEEQLLTDGDVIRVGRTLLTVSLQPIAPPAPAEEMATVNLEAFVAQEEALAAQESAATVMIPSMPAAEPEAPAEPEPEAAIGGEQPPDQKQPEEAAAVSGEAAGWDQAPVAEPEPAPPEPAGPAVAGYLVAGDVRAPIITTLTVGRAEGNDIRVEGDRLVSRNHARLEARPDGIWLDDLKSANGTFRNDVPVTVPVRLVSGDRVRFGGTGFDFEAVSTGEETPRSQPAIQLEEDEAGATQLFSESEPEAAAAPVRGGTDVLPAVDDSDSGATINISDQTLSAESELAEAPTSFVPAIPEPAANLADEYHLIVNFGPETGRSFPLRSDVTVIGRESEEADYDVQLNDRAVSRPHAKIVQEADGFTLHDLDSANGTWVNYTEEISNPRKLSDGDVIKVGKTTLIYRVPASARPAQPDVVLDPTAGQILTAFSLKGGVGTTAIAVNLAVAFRNTAQQSVLLIDLSTERGAVSVHMNIAPKLTLADVPQDPGALDWDLIQTVITSHSTGIDILPAPPSPQTAELVTAAAVTAILPLARARYKWVIIDTSPTFSELNLGVFDQSDLLLLPLAPDMTSVKVMQSTLDVFAALQTPAERRLLILNQTHPRSHIGQAELEQHLGERIGLTLPYADDAILDSIDQGVPLAATNPTHPTVAAIQSFAARLAQVKVEAQEQQKRGGFGTWVQGLIGSLRR